MTASSFPVPASSSPVRSAQDAFEAFDHYRPAPSVVRRGRFGGHHRLIVVNPLPLGTNGYSTAWGTNAHGERSACPPGRG